MLATKFVSCFLYFLSTHVGLFHRYACRPYACLANDDQQDLERLAMVNYIIDKDQVDVNGDFFKSSVFQCILANHDYSYSV